MGYKLVRSLIPNKRGGTSIFTNVIQLERLGILHKEEEIPQTKLAESNKIPSLIGHPRCRQRGYCRPAPADLGLH